jgi:spermidine synthase
LADARQAVLPLLLHPAPRQALFLGLGTGLTARSAAEDRLLSVDAVELLPEVIAAARRFDVAFEGAAMPAGLHIIAADARRFVRATDKTYDVIVADNFHPARSGSGTLYTQEHFEAVRQRLAPQGLFCQWLPLHQLDLPTLKTIVRSYLAVFPAAHVVLATHSLDTPVLGLVGSVAPLASLGLAPALVNERIAGASRQPSAAELGLGDAWAVLGSFVAGPTSLRDWSAAAPLNTDDHPVVAYRAPRFSYAEDSLPRDRLLSLLAQWQASPQDLLPADAAADKNQALQARLSAYWAARNAYLKAGRDVRPSRSVTQMLAQVREPLLQALRTSPDFAPAYDPLLTMAQALAQQDVAAARELLQTLVQVAPTRPEAASALATLPR